MGTGELGIASSINSGISGAGGFVGGVGAGGLVTAALVFLTPLGIIPVILGGLAAAAGSFGLGLLDVDGIHDQIKQKVFELGFEKFGDSLENILAKILEGIESVFESRIETAANIIEQSISLSEDLLEQAELLHQERLEQSEAEKVWIAEKRRQLEQLLARHRSHPD